MAISVCDMTVVLVGKGASVFEGVAMCCRLGRVPFHWMVSASETIWTSLERVVFGIIPTASSSGTTLLVENYTLGANVLAPQAAADLPIAANH